MEDILLKLAIVAMIIFIIWNIYEIIMADIFYKRMTERHKRVIDKLINDTVEEIVNDKDKNN